MKVRFVFPGTVTANTNCSSVAATSPRLQSTDGKVTYYTSVMVVTGVNEGLVAYSDVAVTGDEFDFDGRIVREDIHPIVDYSGIVLP
jgi:hypothetical protein